MALDSAGGPGSPAVIRQRHRAAGIYGTIVTAAVLAAAGARLRTLAMEISILITLVVYWVAEVYAHLLAGPPACGACGCSSSRRSQPRWAC